jgi:voltage-dependent potassium channel beta subunit
MAAGLLTRYRPGTSIKPIPIRSTVQRRSQRIMATSQGKGGDIDWSTVHRAPMPTRKLGRSGLDVSIMGFGSWVSFDYQLDVPRAKMLIERAYLGGINFFDNAEVYAMGKSETIMGEALAELGIPRCDLVITTKIFHGCTREPTVTARGLSRKHIIEGLEASLKRLQLDYVDVVFAHRPDDSVPMEEIVRAFNWVIEKGWAFYWGTSEWSSAQIMEAWREAERLNMVGPVVEQPHYNMLHRKRVEHDLQPVIQSYGVGLTTWSPLASGILTGKYSAKDCVPEDSRFAVKRYQNLKEGILTDENLQAVERLKPLAERHGVKMAQLALAWTMANKDVSTVLTGATKVEQLEENLEAVRLVERFESNEISWEEVGDAISPSTSVMSRF